MADFSEGFIENVNVLSADEQFKILLEISHVDLPEPLRLIDDNCDLVSNGDTYIAFPFKLNFFDDVNNELTKCSISVQNIGRELVKWIESSYGANNAQVDVKLVRRSNPDDIEISLPAFVTRTVVSTKTVNFDLIVAKNNFTQRGTRYVFDVRKAPGLY